MPRSDSMRTIQMVEEIHRSGVLLSSIPKHKLRTLKGKKNISVAELTELLQHVTDSFTSTMSACYIAMTKLHERVRELELMADHAGRYALKNLHVNEISRDVSRAMKLGS